MITGQQPTASIWDRERLWVTVGAVALIFLAAIEALAVTTVMPIVAESLDGRELYAVAFAGTLATSVIGMVAAGAWADSRGPRGALYAAVSLAINTEAERLFQQRRKAGLSPESWQDRLMVIVEEIWHLTDTEAV